MIGNNYIFNRKEGFHMSTYLKRPAVVLMAVLLITALIVAPTFAAPEAAAAESKITSVEGLEIYSTNVNPSGVSNGPNYMYHFEVPKDKKLILQAISVYHYFYGSGGDPGKIFVIDESNNVVGSWETSPRTPEKKDFWDAFPGITIKAGDYYVTCENVDTWSYNAESDEEGFTEIYGTLSSASASQKPAKGVVSKISNVKGAKAKVTVKKVSGATKYQIRYKVGSATKWTTVKKAKSRTFTIKVAKGKTVKVQARVTNKAGTGSWGKTKSFKTDKK